MRCPASGGARRLPIVVSPRPRRFHFAVKTLPSPRCFPFRGGYLPHGSPRLPKWLFRGMALKETTTFPRNQSRPLRVAFFCKPFAPVSRKPNRHISDEVVVVAILGGHIALLLTERLRENHRQRARPSGNRAHSRFLETYVVSFSFLPSLSVAHLVELISRILTWSSKQI